MGLGRQGAVGASPDLAQLPWDRSGGNGTTGEGRRETSCGVSVGISTGDGGGVGECQEPDGLTSPRKRQCSRAQVEGGGRVLDRGQTPRAETDRHTAPLEVLSEWMWKTKRPRLTVLQTGAPTLLDLKQVTDVLGTALEQFMSAVRHAKKRATPAQAWATALETTAAPVVRAVLEAAWKWDGIGGQPDQGLDAPDFELLLLTYRACYTVATEPDILAPWAGLPPGHQTLSDLVQRVRVGMRLGSTPAAYGPVPTCPRPREDQIHGMPDRWRLYALAKAVVYAVSHDGRLHAAL